MTAFVFAIVGLVGVAFAVTLFLTVLIKLADWLDNFWS